MMPAVPARAELVTTAGLTRVVPSTARTRQKAAAVGLVVALLVPLPAAAAPATCPQSLRYAARSGAELMRIADLELGHTEEPIKDVDVGDTKSTLVAQAATKAAALGRVFGGGPAHHTALTDVLRQTAPSSHRRPEQREHDAADVGPF